LPHRVWQKRLDDAPAVEARPWQHVEDQHGDLQHRQHGEGRIEVRRRRDRLQLEHTHQHREKNCRRERPGG